MSRTGSSESARPRAAWRTVALPDEHGGWGLTAEPVLLGLVVAPSCAGVLLGAAAFNAFLVRTPLKVVLVDRHRQRRLPRTRLAVRVAAAELVLLAGLTAGAVALAGWDWLVPVLFAAPLVAVELWFDMRSRSRRLVPELCGAAGMAATASVLATAGGSGAALAAGLWLVLAGRAIASIPFARTQVARLHGHEGQTRGSDLAQVLGAAVAVTAAAFDRALFAGAGAVVALAVAQLVWTRRPAVPAKILGLRQLGLGLAVVAVTATGVLV
jgi:hypothetical protein